ncbi:hypothetical protein OESDEN_24133, partial [Oesophagostomum dentatum]
PEEEETTTTSEVVEVSHFSEEELKYFLKWPEYDFWAGFVKLRNGSREGEEHLDRFFFTTGFHGEALSDWNKRGEMLHGWRRVVDKYRWLINRYFFLTICFIPTYVSINATLNSSVDFESRVMDLGSYRL